MLLTCRRKMVAGSMAVGSLPELPRSIRIHTTLSISVTVVYNTTTTLKKSFSQATKISEVLKVFLHFVPNETMNFPESKGFFFFLIAFLDFPTLQASELDLDNQSFRSSN